MNRIVISIRLVSELRSTISFVVSEEYKYLKMCATSEGQVGGSVFLLCNTLRHSYIIVDFELNRKMKNH